MATLDALAQDAYSMKIHINTLKGFNFKPLPTRLVGHNRQAQVRFLIKMDFGLTPRSHFHQKVNETP